MKKNFLLHCLLGFLCISIFSQSISTNNDTVIVEDRLLMYEADLGDIDFPTNWIRTGNFMKDIINYQLRSVKVLKLYSKETDFALREFRGAWIPTIYNLDWPNTRTSTTAQQKQQLIDLLDDLSTAGFNAVMFQVRPECDALYDSPYEPWSYWLTNQQGTAPNPYYDPLEFAIEEAHKRGMELHAWFNPYRALRSSGDPGSLASNHVVNQHPDWIISFSNGLKILDPGLPQVREYVIKIVSDVVRRYDVDAIHFDDYFYPYSPGIGNADASTFTQYNRGFTDIGDWRRDNVNLLIEGVYDSINLIKPHVKFGISPFGIWKNGVPSGIVGLDAYNVIFADAVSWMEQEIIDYLSPQLYWAFGGGQDYATLAPWWESVRNNRHLYIGHGAYKADSQTHGGALFNEAEIPLQVRFNRDYDGIDGSVYYRAKNITHFHTQGLEDSLKNTLYKHPAIIPSLDWKDHLYAHLSPPSNLSYSWTNENTVVLEWEAPPPPAYGNDLIRYAVYRINSPDAPQLPNDIYDPKNLISVQPSLNFTDNPPFSNNPYYYVVTALNRNYNQSEPSNMVNTSGTGNLTVITSEVSLISHSTAVTGGNITEDGGLSVNARGVVWSSNPNPTISTNQGITNNGSGIGSFVSNLTNLNPGTTYYVRAYATNVNGTTYGQQISFTTELLDDIYVKLSDHYNVSNNDIVTVILSVNGLSNDMHPLGIQGTIQYNKSLLEYVGYEEYQLEGSSLAISEVDGHSDLRTILWSTDHGNSTMTNGNLIGLKFLFKGEGEVCGSISWTSDPLPKMLIDDNWNEIEAIWENSEICGVDEITVSGTVKYAGKVDIGASNPIYNNPIYYLDSVIVVLETLQGIEVNRDTTKNGGEFFIDKIFDEGDYIIKYYKLNDDYNKWINSATGVNVADVGMFRTHILNPYNERFYFDEIYRIALDFNNDGSLNAVDVSMLQTKIVNPFNPFHIEMENFLPNGTWMGGSKEITISSDVVDLECVIIAYGDYNASANGYMYSDFSTESWTSEKSSKSYNFIIKQEDNILTVERERFTVPLVFDKDYQDIFGVQLEMEYPEDRYTLKSANIKIEDKYVGNEINIDIGDIINENQDLLITDLDGIIRLLYISPNDNSFEISSQDAFLKLEFETSDSENAKIEDFYLLGNIGLLALSNFDVISSFNLIMPQLIEDYSQVSLSELLKIQVYPNPANNIIFLDLDSFDKGFVDIKLFDILGREALSITNKRLFKGKNIFELDVTELNSGVYTLTICYKNGVENKLINVKILVN